MDPPSPSHLRPWHTGLAADGWTGFHLAPLPTNLEALGFLTATGCARVREVCGVDYTALELFEDVRARGWAWLPWTVLEAYAPWDVALARRVHREFTRRGGAPDSP